MRLVIDNVSSFFTHKLLTTRLASLIASEPRRSPPASTPRRPTMGCAPSTPQLRRAPAKTKTESRENAWKATGIVALRDSNLRELPDKLFDGDGEFALKLRNVDATNNKIKHIPREIGNCVNITRLVLASNLIESLPEELGTLTKLKTLVLDNNRISSLPDSIGSLKALTTLSACECELTTLPTTLSTCTSLTTVKCSKNTSLDSSALDALADCERLEEIDLSSCALTVVPASVGRLKRLKKLNIENNVGVHTIPSDVFKSCEALTKLTAYGTSVRNVEYTDGYDTYVERVKMRHGKIISGNSMIVDEQRGLDYGFDHTAS